MEFEPLYYNERLRIFNLTGDVGVVTLWSRVNQTVKVLEELNIDLSIDKSRISVIANLYGNGLPHMLRNLLWNPQIKYLLIVGHDLSGSKQDLVNFFKYGLEETSFQGTAAHKIIGTHRIIDDYVTPKLFNNRIIIRTLDKLSDESSRKGIIDFFSTLADKESSHEDRVDIPIPKVEISRYPSEPRNHNILRRSPIGAWKELVFKLVRFGHRNQLKKGERVELQNMKVIITNPVIEDEVLLSDIGFSLDNFRRYQDSIINPVKPEDIEYTYGNRIRNYFKFNGKSVDSLRVAIDRLKTDPETRHAYVSIWDNNRDLPVGNGCPCLVSLFFRCFDGKLTLTATFRSHNTMDAWLENLYGLMSIQQFVADGASMQIGAITVFSHSISISPDALDKAKLIAATKETDDQRNLETGKWEPRFDYNGSFMVTIDDESSEIVVQHSFEGLPLTEYRGRSSIEIENQLARDCAVSEISHALYLGREIALKEAILKKKK